VSQEIKFSVGQLIQHKLFGYRGVIYDVDGDFQGTAEWYRTVARSGPPRDEPWYHVLVHGAEHTTYVAQRNLEPDDQALPIVHPLVDMIFGDFVEGCYVRQMH
jgi:heat shock protein HspQ